jgi:DNA-binding MarR family transcriptional regulator
MPQKLETSSTSRPSPPRAWIRFLRAHTAITTRMDAALREAHDISLREYEVLLALSDAPDRRLRRVDLAAKVLLTQSGVTRLLEPLERRGLVGRTPSPEDRRVTFASLTEAGARLLAAAAERHLADIRTLFADLYTDRELATLDRLLQRLPGAGGEGAWADD